jgi:hypothetical protein
MEIPVNQSSAPVLTMTFKTAVGGAPVVVHGSVKDLLEHLDTIAGPQTRPTYDLWIQNTATEHDIIGVAGKGHPLTLRDVQWIKDGLCIFESHGEAVLLPFLTKKAFTLAFIGAPSKLPGIVALQGLRDRLGHPAPGYLFFDDILIYACASPTFGPFEYERARWAVIRACVHPHHTRPIGDDTEAKEYLRLTREKLKKYSTPPPPPMDEGEKEGKKRRSPPRVPPSVPHIE